MQFISVLLLIIIIELTNANTNCNIGSVSWYMSYYNNAGYLGAIQASSVGLVGPGLIPVCQEKYGARPNTGSELTYDPIPTTNTLHCFSDLIGLLSPVNVPMFLLGDPSGYASYLLNTTVAAVGGPNLLSNGFLAIPDPGLHFNPNDLVSYNQSVYYTMDFNNFWSVALYLPNYTVSATYEIKAKALCLSYYHSVSRMLHV